VLLEIDASRVQAEVRVENLEGGEQLFPHIYGPLHVDAVRYTKVVPVGADGRLLIGSVLGT